MIDGIGLFCTDDDCVGFVTSNHGVDEKSFAPTPEKAVNFFVAQMRLLARNNPAEQARIQARNENYARRKAARDARKAASNEH